VGYGCEWIEGEITRSMAPVSDYCAEMSWIA